MEQLQIHSRSYIVRWIHVRSGDSISWSLQPHKKSINFGIFKHPGAKTVTANLPASATLDIPPTPSDKGFVKTRRNSSAKERDGPSPVIEKLQVIGLKLVSWSGKCEADQVSMGRYDVQEGEDGMFGLVIDNTFSKTVAKTATFVLMTHPTNAPPKSGAQLRYSHTQAATSSTSVGRSPSLQPSNISNDSLPHDPPASVHSNRTHKPGSMASSTGGFYTGVMHKKRRKKNQGYARRFFSLDFTSSTLSYYRNSHASALRGSVPLALAAIGVDEKRKEFSIDSGAEVWHLRLRSKRDFENWKHALERATTSSAPSPLPAVGRTSRDDETQTAISDPLVEREWFRVEELIGRVSGSRDAMRRLAQDTDPKYSTTNGTQAPGSPGISPIEGNPFFPDSQEKEPQKLPFWKRKTSSSGAIETRASVLRRSVSAQGGTSSAPMTNGPLSPALPVPKLTVPSSAGVGQDIHERCMALLKDLDATVAEFTALVQESKSRRRPNVGRAGSRRSLESSASDDFFDAEEAPDAGTKLISIRHSDEVTDERDDFFSDEESLASSDADASLPLRHSTTFSSSSLFPSVPKIILPSDLPAVTPRTTIPPPRQPPPSIVSFLRKNAGKDLSTVAMPVTANEPLSLLQRAAEPFESVSLLHHAASSPDAIDRLLHITAFAISVLAANRVKERAVRKPFNPMLGETYELVRRGSDSSGYRFVSEKIHHHPVRMAWQADDLAGKWSVAQSPRPVQKFWGKSIEVNTEGRFRLVLANKERYSWTQPTAYLRNVLAGEKYVEPSGSLTVTEETSGAKAVVQFKSAGMFSGRSEEVSAVLFSSSGSREDAGLTGTWTRELRRSDTEDVIWRAGEVDEAGSSTKRGWGFSVFAAGLNEVTQVEQQKVPPTDSRLRPDQRALEKGELDQAEAVKARLEERQRGRRKVLEAHGDVHRPFWFEKAGDGGSAGEVDDAVEEEVWRLRTGKDGYWERREKGDWKGLLDVFEM